MLAFTREWLAYRRAQPALIHGAIRFLDLGPDILGFERGEGNERRLVLFNLGEAERRAALPSGAWTVDFALGAKLDSEAVLSGGGGLVLKPS